MSVARAFLVGQATPQELSDNTRILLYRLGIKLPRPLFCLEPRCPICRPIPFEPDDPRSTR